jgi:hypothetical protein
MVRPFLNQLMSGVLLVQREFLCFFLMITSTASLTNKPIGLGNMNYVIVVLSPVCTICDLADMNSRTFCQNTCLDVELLTYIEKLYLGIAVPLYIPNMLLQIMISIIGIVVLPILMS